MYVVATMVFLWLLPGEQQEDKMPEMPKGKDAVDLARAGFRQVGEYYHAINAKNSRQYALWFTFLQQHLLSMWAL